MLIRLLKEYGYVDAANGGLTLALANASGATQNPARSLWISRFYDRDVVSEKVRPIEDHAEELRQLICETIPRQLKSIDGASVDLGKKDEDYRVILLAHSMGGLVCRCLIQNLLPAEIVACHHANRLGQVPYPFREIIDLLVLADFEPIFQKDHT